jgi:hypothetical protein
MLSNARNSLEEKEKHCARRTFLKNLVLRVLTFRLSNHELGEVL